MKTFASPPPRGRYGPCPVLRLPGFEVSNSEAPGVCNDYTQFYKYNGTAGGWKLAGDFVGPPEGWVG